MNRHKKKPSQTEWAYLAGIIDGEGCISLIQRGARSSSAFAGSVAVGNTDKNLISWLQQNFGGLATTYQHKLSTKWMYRWYVKAANTANILEGVLPYLVIKHKQANLLLQYRRTVQAQGKPASVDIFAQRVQIAGQMRKLNGKGK